MCGSGKYHQQLRGSKNSVVNLINRSILRESIEEPNEKIDFDTDKTVLKVHEQACRQDHRQDQPHQEQT